VNNSGEVLQAWATWIFVHAAFPTTPLSRAAVLSGSTCSSWGCYITLLMCRC